MIDWKKKLKGMLKDVESHKLRAFFGGMRDCSKVTGISMETLKRIRTMPGPGVECFDSNNRIRMKKLLPFLIANLDLIAERGEQEIPNLHNEKAIRARIQRRLDQVELEKKLGTIVFVKDLKPTLQGLAKIIRTRLLVLPDRWHQKYAAMTDALAIKEDSLHEIKAALRELETFDVETWLKEQAGENKNKG